MLNIEQINELREHHKNTIEKKASYGISTEGDMAIMLLWDIYEMLLKLSNTKEAEEGERVPENMGFCELRKNAGITQEELAKSLGMQQSSISNWENGITKPDLPTALKIADVINVPVEKIVKCFA